MASEDARSRLPFARSRWVAALAIAWTTAACVLDWSSLRAVDAGSPDGEPGDAGNGDEPVLGDERSRPETGILDAGEAQAACDDEGILINELQTGGSAGASDEFVELFNRAACEVKLTGWTLRYSSASGSAPFVNWTGGANDKLGPGAYAVIGGATYPGQVMGKFNIGTGTLSSSGGGMGIYAASGTPIDSVAYGAVDGGHPLVRPPNGRPAPAPPQGQSIARVPNGVDTSVNASDFVVGPPTAGEKN